MLAPPFITTNAVVEGCECQATSAKRSITAPGISLRLSDCTVYTCKHTEPHTLVEYNIIVALFPVHTIVSGSNNTCVITPSLDHLDVKQIRPERERKEAGERR